MRIKNFVWLFAFVLFLIPGVIIAQQQVNQVKIHSAKMALDVNNMVILPANYDRASPQKYPVVYLLHGHGGNQNSFLKLKPNLPDLSTQQQIIFVCPDGKVSWYWDSPIDPKTQFDTYVSKELIAYIDSHYNTISDKRGRAVTGFSMGGHGALWMAINHPDVFGAAGSMSGGVDIRPFPKSWNMANSLGEYISNKSVWNAHTIATHTEKLRATSPALIIDCGQDDFFIKVNEDLHRDLLEKKIIHTYIVSPGIHNSEYWNKAMNWQIAFFKEFFTKSK